MVTSVTLDASEASARQSNYPLFVGRNILEQATSVVVEQTSVSNLALLTDRRALPVLLFPGSQATWSIVFQVPSTPFVKADTLAILGTNIPSIAMNLSEFMSINVQVSDDTSFSTSETFGAQVMGGDGRRIVFYSDRQFSSFAYVKIEIAALVPPSMINDLEIGELFFGRRQQMRHSPQRPLAWDGTDKREEIVLMPGGHQVGVVDYYGRRVWDLQWKLRNVRGRHGRDILREWWRDSRGGQGHVFIPRPNSHPHEIFFARSPTESLVVSETRRNIFETTHRLEELPPFYDREESL